MSSHRITLTLVLGLLSGVVSSPTWAQETCWCQHEQTDCEPRIKFLDDLWLLGRVPSFRDPFEERIETERHDFTQSTKMVGRHVCQIEMGYTYFYLDNEEEIEQSHNTPEMLMRFGLTDDVEFRVRWTYAWGFVDEADNVDSAEDMRFSFKLAVTDQRDWIPESALDVNFTAPTGGVAFSSKSVEWGLDYIYGWELYEGWTLSGSTQFGTRALGEFGLVPEEPSADWFIIWAQSAAVGFELGERTTMYNEFYGVFSHALADNYAIVVYNAGVDYFITDDLVIDVRVGIGLTPDSDDFFTGIGGGYRF